MKTIKIAHLYYDLMNLYGENGNVLCLKKYLENQNIAVSVDYLTKDDKIDFNKYDIYYIGSGNDENFLITLKSFHTLTLCIVQKQSRKKHIIYLNYSILKSYDLIINQSSSLNFSSKHSKQLFAST